MAVLGGSGQRQFHRKVRQVDYVNVSKGKANLCNLYTYHFVCLKCPILCVPQASYVVCASSVLCQADVLVILLSLYYHFCFYCHFILITCKTKEDVLGVTDHINNLYIHRHVSI